jgi:pyruvate/2-oxoglutarate dehydrogenase complex dihydrolipoamide acyltransferase (E2) component
MEKDEEPEVEEVHVEPFDTVEKGTKIRGAI